MARISTALFASIVAAALFSGTAFMPTPAEAAKMSKADKIALKQATVSCKAEAKGKHIWWPASRKFVNNCVKESLKDHPNINVIQLQTERPMKRLPEQQVKDPI